MYEDYHLCYMTIPYTSGFLGFREIPEYKTLLEKIKDKPFYPDILMVDGFGSASHLGFKLYIPTIGISKTLLCIDGLNEHNIKKNLKKMFYTFSHLNAHLYINEFLYCSSEI
jgi:endonuclease V